MKTFTMGLMVLSTCSIVLLHFVVSLTGLEKYFTNVESNALRSRSQESLLQNQSSAAARNGVIENATDSSIPSWTVFQGQHSSFDDALASIKTADHEIHIDWNGNSPLNSVIRRYWRGNLFCEQLNEKMENQTTMRTTTTTKNVLLNVTFGCSDLFRTSDAGTGNFLSLFYGLRLTARVFGNVDVIIQCSDAQKEKENLILPWVTGWFPRRKEKPNVVLPSKTVACAGYEQLPIAYVVDEMRYELRRMAIALVGVPQHNKEHPSHAFAERYLWSQQRIGEEEVHNRVFQISNPTRGQPPLYPETTLDDAIIHFRCGDLMRTNHPSFGFLKFSALARLVSPDARSIGVVTQPFDRNDQQRQLDLGKGDRCRLVVLSLVDYLKSQFPGAVVRLHNSHNETIALTYARMIMANQTISPISTFSVFPAIANFGQGYIRRPDYKKAPNRWLLNPPVDVLADDVTLFDEPDVLKARQVNRMWSEDPSGNILLAWFKQ
jgi:hypothetical protein